MFFLWSGVDSLPSLRFFIIEFDFFLLLEKGPWYKAWSSSPPIFSGFPLTWHFFQVNITTLPERVTHVPPVWTSKCCLINSCMDLFFEVMWGGKSFWNVYGCFFQMESGSDFIWARHEVCFPFLGLHYTPAEYLKCQAEHNSRRCQSQLHSILEAFPISLSPLCARWKT